MSEMTLLPMQEAHMGPPPPSMKRKDQALQTDQDSLDTPPFLQEMTCLSRKAYSKYSVKEESKDLSYG